MVWKIHPCTTFDYRRFHPPLALRARKLRLPSSRQRWRTTEAYKGGALGHALADVVVEDFCMNRCGMHGSTRVKKGSNAYAGWVPASQCPVSAAVPEADCGTTD
ncbi:hypothetical protein HAX54_017527 [Datura stramonium]|uniref:Uncharacterized protein n=1 Tax=Datura stramonium TaxID=4076 RepID=A0ABS8UN53_DATST|nr:hypothetical protein [Datura stramonium]